MVVENYTAQMCSKPSSCQRQWKLGRFALVLCCTFIKGFTAAGPDVIISTVLGYTQKEVSTKPCTGELPERLMGAFQSLSEVPSNDFRGLLNLPWYSPPFVGYPEKVVRQVVAHFTAAGVGHFGNWC